MPAEPAGAHLASGHVLQAARVAAAAAQAGTVPGGPAQGSPEVEGDLLHLIESIGAGPTSAAERPYRPADATSLTAPAGSSQLPVGGIGGGSAGTSAGSAGGPLLAGVPAVVLIAAGGWFVLLLLRESYRNTVFLALPERPG